MPLNKMIPLTYEIDLDDLIDVLESHGLLKLHDGVLNEVFFDPDRRTLRLKCSVSKLDTAITQHAGAVNTVHVRKMFKDPTKPPYLPGLNPFDRMMGVPDWKDEQRKLQEEATFQLKMQEEVQKQMDVTKGWPALPPRRHCTRCLMMPPQLQGGWYEAEQWVSCKACDELNQPIAGGITKETLSDSLRMMPKIPSQ